ncbi:MAG: hypothetical protein LBQ66_02295 [Planctomycetaceae bacterium]|jgi:hypothetical protein|nr:hypothetical protein [Planctomycetaceae bacterium]
MLPDDLITGLYLSYSVSSELFNPGKFYIRRFVNHSTGFTLYIAYHRGTGLEDYDLAELSVDYETITPGETLNLLGMNIAFLSGHLSLGDFSGIARQPIGEWEFDPSGTTLDPFCIRFVAKEISALYVQNKGVVSGPFYGTIHLIAGTGINLVTRSAEETLHCLENPVTTDGTEVVINALHEEDPNVPEKYVKSINGVYPDSRGNIELVGQACLTITPHGEHSLLFRDKCAEPCCNCEELLPIEQKTQEFRATINNLASRTDMLYAQAVQLTQIATILTQRQ